MNKGLVNKIIPFSSVDGPGNRMAVFLQGCNFNCLYCHNPETIKRCDHCFDRCIKSCPNLSSPKALFMDVDEIVKEVKRVKSFISGITVSGGECMLQAEFLKELFVEIKNMELSIFVDTNGSVPFWENSELTALMDKAMVDMKAFLPEEHIGLTGMDNKNVLKNIEYLASIDKLYELRTVIVPDILDNYFNVDAISKLIAALNPDIRYKLIKYRPFGVRKELMISQIPSDNMMKELVQISRDNGCINIVVT